MRRSLFPLFASLLVLVASTVLPAQTAPAPAVAANAPYKDAHLAPDRRVADLLSRMTLEEKATMLSGSGWMESAPIERLGIPADQDGRRADGRALVGGQLGDHQPAGRAAEGAVHLVSLRAWPWPPPGTPNWCSARARPSRRR